MYPVEAQPRIRLVPVMMRSRMMFTSLMRSTTYGEGSRTTIGAGSGSGDGLGHGPQTAPAADFMSLPHVAANVAADTAPSATVQLIVRTARIPISLFCQ